MGLFENFPYTNFHNLNLDWIIKVLKNAVTELEEIQTNWESVRDTANTAKTTANAAKTTADAALTSATQAATNATEAKKLATTAEMNSAAAQDTAVEAQAIANEANETAARAEIVAGAAQSTANAAKKTADGVDAKATTALENSTNAVTTADAAKKTADGVDTKATTALENSTNAVTTANTAKTIADRNTNAIISQGEKLSKDISDGDSAVLQQALTAQDSAKAARQVADNALSLAQTNEQDIASNDADIATLESAAFVSLEPSVNTASAGTYTINVSSTVSYTPYDVQVTAPQSLVNWLTEVRDLLTLYDVVYDPALLANTSGGEYRLPVLGSVIDSQNTLHMYALLPYSSDDTDGVVSIENINAHLVYRARRKPTV